MEVQLEDVKPGILWNIGKVREDSDLLVCGDSRDCYGYSVHSVSLGFTLVETREKYIFVHLGFIRSYA